MYNNIHIAKRKKNKFELLIEFIFVEISLVICQKNILINKAIIEIIIIKFALIIVLFSKKNIAAKIKIETKTSKSKILADIFIKFIIANLLRINLKERKLNQLKF